MLDAFILFCIIWVVLLLWNVWIIRHDKELTKDPHEEFIAASKRVDIWINDDNFSYLRGIARLHFEFETVTEWTANMNREFYRYLGYMNGRINVRREFEKGSKEFRDGYYI